MVIKQGDIFWVDLGVPFGSESGFKRPYTVIQNNPVNSSSINTIIVCSITSNLKWAAAPGNVKLKKGEGKLTKPSVIIVSQIMTLDKGRFLEKIGSLSQKRMMQVIAGVQLLLNPAA